MTCAFDYVRPGSVSEVCSILLETGDRAALLAGGVDLMIRLKRKQRTADVVIDLGALAAPAAVESRPEGLWLGATVTMEAIAREQLVVGAFPWIAQAARQVGSAQLRAMSTLGGALCGGLRCQFHDQSEFWRHSIGRCLREGGATCHAAPRSRQCQATVACDLPPALVATGAQLVLAGPDGERHLAAESLYSGEGLHHLTLQRGELLLGALIPWTRRAPLWAGGYLKTRLRRSVDRPLVGLAFTVATTKDGLIEDLRIALCGDGPALRPTPGLEAFRGAHLDEPLVEALSRQVARSFDPSPALRVDLAWRRSMAQVMTLRALGALSRRQPHPRPSQGTARVVEPAGER